MDTKDFKLGETRLSQIFERAPSTSVTRFLGQDRNLQEDVCGAQILTYRPTPKKIRDMYKTTDVTDPMISRRMKAIGIVAFDEIDLDAKQKPAISKFLDVPTTCFGVPKEARLWQRLFDYTHGELETGGIPIIYKAEESSSEMSQTKSMMSAVPYFNTVLDYASDSDNSTECMIEGGLYRLDRARATRYPEREVLALAEEIRSDGVVDSDSEEDDYLVNIWMCRPEIDECLTPDTSVEDVIRICSCPIPGLPNLTRDQLKVVVNGKLRTIAGWRQEQRAPNPEPFFYEDNAYEAFTPPFNPSDWRETVAALGALHRRKGMRKVIPDRQVFAVSYKHERRSGLCRMTANTFFEIAAALGEMSYRKVQLWIDTLNSVNLNATGAKWIDIGLAPYRKYKVVVANEPFAKSEKREVTRLWLAIEMGLGYENRGLIVPRRTVFFNSLLGTLALEPKVLTKQRWQAAKAPVEQTLACLLSRQSLKYKVTYEADRLEIINYVRRTAFLFVGGMDASSGIPEADLIAEIEVKVALGSLQPMKTDYDHRKEFGCVINTILESEPCWKGPSTWSYSSICLTDYAVPSESWVIFKKGSRGIAFGIVSVAFLSARRTTYGVRVAKLVDMQEELYTGHVSSILEAKGLFDSQFLIEFAVMTTATNDLTSYERMVSHLDEAGLMAWLGKASDAIEVGHVPGHGIRWT